MNDAVAGAGVRSAVTGLGQVWASPDSRVVVLCAAVLLAGWAAGATQVPDSRANYWRRCRTMTVLVALILVVAAVGGAPFGALLALLGIAAVAELRALYSRPPVSHTSWIALGALYVAPPCLALAAIRHEHGFGALVYLLAVVQLTDLGGFLVGRRWGRRALVPALSPAKTRAGMLGGGAFALAAAALFGFALPRWNALEHALVALVLSVASQSGDLFASWLKRRRDASEFGARLPGHGGVIDRFDGCFVAAPVAWWLLDGPLGGGAGAAGAGGPPATSAWLAILLGLSVAAAVTGVRWMERDIERRRAGRP